MRRWLAQHKPTEVVLSAAKVGGIRPVSLYSVEFLARQPEGPEQRDRNGLTLRSAALAVPGQQLHYTKRADQPIREEAQLTWPLEHTNEWYAIAKITGIMLCHALSLQHGFDAISL